MSSIALLMGLLLLSYVGSLIVGGQAASRGTPSGVEYIVVGLVVGPHALALVDRSMIADFAPIAQVALGWLTFMIGLDFGRVQGRRVRLKAMVLGVTGALLTGMIVTFSVYRYLVAFPQAGLSGSSAFILAAGAGAVTAETTRFAVQWVSARWDAKGPLSDLLVEIAASDDFAPLVAVGALFAMEPPRGATVDLPPSGWFLVSVALGGLLGTVTALLLRGAEGYAVWGALLGTLLLGVGAAERLGLCSIFVTFVMGIALAALSPSRRVLRRMVGSTERAILLPTLLLAGARVDAREVLSHPSLVAVVAIAILARIFGKFVAGTLFRVFAPAARPAGPMLGAVLLSSGTFSIGCGLVLALRFPGLVGDTLLIVAMASVVTGELVSTLGIKRLLERVGEMREPPPSLDPGSATRATPTSPPSASTAQRTT